MSRRLRIMGEIEGTKASQFFTARKREIRSYSAFTIFRRRYFPHRSSLSRSMLIGWKKDSTRESRIVPGGIFFARGIALLSITDATRMRSTHTHARTRAIRVGSFHARLSLWNTRITKRYDTSSNRHLRKHTHRNNASIFPLTTESGRRDYYSFRRANFYIPRGQYSRRNFPGKFHEIFSLTFSRGRPIFSLFPIRTDRIGGKRRRNGSIISDA